MAKLYPAFLAIKLVAFCFALSVAVYVVITSAQAEAATTQREFSRGTPVEALKVEAFKNVDHEVP